MASESYLVTGGCGLQGSSIVETLKSRYPDAPVTVLTRNPTINTFAGVSYYRGDITSAEDVSSCLQKHKPTVVFHCAAAIVGARKHVSEALVRTINVDGTAILLEQCARSGVRAFVFTSSVSVIQKDGANISGADETWPLIDDSDVGATIYPRTKAESERLVTAADDARGMRTASIRPSAIHGERDNDVTPIIMRTSGLRKIQFGDNSRRFDTTYVGNSTLAHLLAAEKLLSPDAKVRDAVGGQVFFVTNGASVTYYEFARSVMQHGGIGGGPKSPEYDPRRLWVIPAGVALRLAWACEWWAWLWGTAPLMTRPVIAILTMERSFNIEKARKLLGYEPETSWEEACRRAGEWWLKNRKNEAEIKTK